MDSLFALTYTSLENWAVTWLPIIFMGLIVLLIALMLRYMPRTRPQQIKPESSESMAWGEVAGLV